ncbi:MAG: glycosyltransferase family 2 protein, partial [Candidatus Kapaibacteriota bacterium]
SLVLNDETRSKKGAEEFIASIIIPVFNKVELTKQCIQSILENTPEFKELQLIIVDNASTDGTKEYLAQIAQNYKNMYVITNSRNLGFARACNQGISATHSKYIVLLNNDTFVTEGWLTNLIQEAESSDDIGIVGSRLLYPNSTLIQHIGVKFVKLIDYIAYHYAKLRDLKYTPEAFISKDYNCVTFACVLIKKEVFKQIGLLDDEYVNSYEDVDFCIRAREAGYRIRYCANSVIYYCESTSPGRFEHDQQNFQLLNKKWGKILEKYIDKENGELELFELWAREEL